MRKNTTIRLASLFVATGLALSMSACGSGGDAATDDKKDDKESASEKEEAPDGPFGAACADVPKDGDGSFDGMAQDPVATAASNNPALSTLVTAVGEAGLVDTLNSEKNLTVFAPANSAFEKIPKKDLDALLKDKDALTDVLTYHVIGETITPEQLGTEGPFKSLQGAEVTASGSGEDFKINDSAAVACGNVQTANATVYIIDTVLMPPKE